MAELTLEELALRAQANADGRERDAYFSELVRRLRGRLGSFLLRKTGRPHDVDDLVQETFLRAYRNLERYRPTWRFSTWLFTIATRLAANHHRARRNQPAGLDSSTAANAAATSPDSHFAVMSSLDGSADTPATLVAERQESEQLWATAKSVLSDAQYAVIWLHYAKDMSVKEIAQATGRTAMHVRVLLYRGRKKLAAEVACSAP